MDVAGVQLASGLLLLLCAAKMATQHICDAPITAFIQENNQVDQEVVMVTLEPGVTVSFTTPPGLDPPFRLDGNRLLARKQLDHEEHSSYDVKLTCRKEDPPLTRDVEIYVRVTNVNDNRPYFVEDPCQLEVRELSPVDAMVGSCLAVDRDPNTRLFYKLSSDTDGVKLLSPTSPDVVVQAPLYYHQTKFLRLTLYVQDTPLLPPPVTPSFNDSCTLLVNITDVDTRPPWFQPCTIYPVGEDVICYNNGYRGHVTFGELQVGVLQVRAVDGDDGINEAITYSIIGANEGNAGMFEIDPHSGNISMLRAAQSLEPIILTVMATQRTNSFQVTTTTVTLTVLEKSLHPPTFQKLQYHGIANAVGTMVLELNTKQPLRIQATDQDYAEGLNPYIHYSINSSDFSLVGTFLFMIKDLPEGTFDLRAEAVDGTNNQSATADVMVTVMAGVSTETPGTTIPTSGPNTSGPVLTTPPTPGPNTSGPVVTTPPAANTISSSVSPDLTTPDALTDPVPWPAGAYGPEDMAALGVTLGAGLLACLLVIGLLLCRLQRNKADWRKICQATEFKSSLDQGSSGLREGIQFTNPAYHKESGDEGVPANTSSETQRDIRRLDAILPPPESPYGNDSPKEVRPILTKERRQEEGYKAVWFKEDIDPNAKEEVVIIPVSPDEEEEHTSSNNGDEEEDNNSQQEIPKVFADSDLDSGLGVKMDEQADKTEEEEEQAAKL